MRNKLVFYSIVILLILLGFLSIYKPETIESMFPFLSMGFIEEIGKAFLIAGILAGSVDIYLKGRLATELATKFVRDVSPFIEGHGLPQEFQNEIAFIRRILVFRKDLELTYRIHRMAAPNTGYVRLGTTANYTVVNQTEGSCDYPMAGSCEDAYPEIGRARILSAGTSGGGIEPFSYSLTENNFGDTVASEDSMLTFKKIVPIEPNAGPNTFWIETESYEEENGSDIFYMVHPTTSITVHVEAPADFDVEVYIGHRFQDSFAKKITKIPPPPNKTHTWHISAAMLTWHSIYVRWKGKKSPPAQ